MCFSLVEQRTQVCLKSLRSLFNHFYEVANVGCTATPAEAKRGERGVLLERRRQGS